MIIGDGIVLGAGGETASIIVTAPTGSTVTCTTPGGVVLTATEVSGTWTFTKLKVYGTYTVTAINGIKTATQDVLVDSATQYDIELEYKLWLYKDGDECTDVTGGWAKISTKGVITKYSDHMDLSATEAPSSVTAYYFSTVNGINTKGYKTLYADVSMVNGASNYFRLGLSGVKTEAFLVSTGKGDNTRSTVSVNISAYQGAGFYPEMLVHRRSDYQCVVSVYKIWLE